MNALTLDAIDGGGGVPYLPSERWHAIQGKWKHLKELGTRSKAACKDVMDGIEELLERLDLKHSVFDNSGDSGAIDPNTGGG